MIFIKLFPFNNCIFKLLLLLLIIYYFFFLFLFVLILLFNEKACIIIK